MSTAVCGVCTAPEATDRAVRPDSCAVCVPDDALRATLRLPDGAPLSELADRATRLAGTAWPERVERAGLSGVSPDSEELTERPAIMHPCHGALRAHAQ